MENLYFLDDDNGGNLIHIDYIELPLGTIFKAFGYEYRVDEISGNNFICNRL
jgi:hypothetical protein